MDKERTILIVDDNIINLQVLANFLDQDGFDIMVSQDGENGLELAQLGQPDIILLDVMMPGIDGFETCRRLKVNEATKDIPVIFMTALTSEENKLKAFEVGAVDYITKPIQQGEVLARITTHLQIHTLTEKLQQETNILSKRTTQLEISSQIAQQVSSILDFDELLNQIVNLIQTKFDYYHVHIYLLDKARKNLVIALGSGSAGVEMKRQGHRIAVDTSPSLVALAARTGELILVDNVRERPDWLANPLLPHTQAEMAIPIFLTDQVVGVLGVQQDRIAGLDNSDAQLMRSLSSQLGVAIHNIRLFEQVEDELSYTRTVQEKYIKQGWQTASSQSSQQQGHHLYHRPDVPDLSPAITSQLEELAVAQNQATVVGFEFDPAGQAENKADRAAIVAPIQLGNQSIGTIQIHEVDHPRYWSDRDIALVQVIVEQVAQTAENLRLFDETHQRADYERLVGEVTQKIRQAPNMEALTRIAVEAVSTALGATGGTVSLNINAETDRSEKNNGHSR